MNPTPSISWDSDSMLATFNGPGGFTQLEMTRPRAWAIALALGVEFYTSQPGTTLKASA